MLVKLSFVLSNSVDITIGKKISKLLPNIESLTPPSHANPGKSNSSETAGVSPKAAILKKEGQRVQYVLSLDNNQLWERAHDPEVGLIVKVNQSHRLYKDIIEPYRENAPLIKTIDVLFFALARGEFSLIYKSEFDENIIEEIIDEYRERVGNDLSEIIKKLNIKNVFEG